MNASALHEPRPEVDTTLGRVRGVRDQSTGVCAYLGLPYAAPPVGPRRFRPPAPAAGWSGVRDASRFGPPAAQYFDPHEAPLDELVDAPPASVPRWVGSEDCLTLNVWTKASPGERRPVLVWIHGGANWLESSRLRVYHGAALAAAGAVFVSLNYRLGVFGFTDVAALGDESYAGSHSLGLRDQLAALDWVHANVERFGGDPANVTVVGESAGSMDLSWLIAGGHLDGRARRAVLMSGVAGVPGLAQHDDYDFYAEAEGRRQARELYALLGIDGVSQLLATSTGELLERLARAVPSRDMLFHWDSLFYPRVDGTFLPRTPFEAVQAGAARGLDLMVGSTAYEMSLWLLWDDGLDARDPRELARRLPGFPPAVIPAAAEAYERWFGHGGAGSPGLHLLGDAMFVMPALALAALQAQVGGRAYAYQFTWECADPRLKAVHAADVGFFLGTFETPGAEALIGAPGSPRERAARRELAGRMQSALLAFAERGDPNPLDVAPRERWLAYSTELRSLMLFGSPSRVAYDPLLARRSWWQQHVYGRRLPGAP